MSVRSDNYLISDANRKLPMFKLSYSWFVIREEGVTGINFPTVISHIPHILLPADVHHSPFEIKQLRDVSSPN